MGHALIALQPTEGGAQMTYQANMEAGARSPKWA